MQMKLFVPSFCLVVALAGCSQTGDNHSYSTVPSEAATGEILPKSKKNAIELEAECPDSQELLSELNAAAAPTKYPSVNERGEQNEPPRPARRVGPLVLYTEEELRKFNAGIYKRNPSSMTGGLAMPFGEHPFGPWHPGPVLTPKP
jgi:hypothetical protein